jgi:hypothetical protein
MKKFTLLYVLAAALLVVVSLTHTSCDGNDPDPKADALKQLTGSWQVSRVTVDGMDKTDLFDDFSLVIASKQFSAANGEPVWPASGTWSFTNGQTTTFTRDDGVIVTIASVSSTRLTLSLAWTKTTYGAGRSASVSGEHVFEFTK